MRMMYKGILLSLFILFLGVFINTQHAQALSEGWFEYTDNGDGTATITGYTRTGGMFDETIPEMIGGLTVTAIGDYAFFQKGLNSVTIPSSVKRIGIASFNLCGLTKVNLSEGLTHIGNDAFSNNRIESVTIPASVISIGKDAFTFNPRLSVSQPHEITIRGYDPSEARWYAQRTGHTFVSLTPYTVTYHGNGATSGQSPHDAGTYLQGKQVTVLGNTGNLTRVGYHFVGWNTNSNGSGTTYTAGNTFPMGLGHVTLYAKWEPLPLPTITLLGENPFHIEKESVFTDPGATAKDYADVEITVTSNSSAIVDMNVVGEYTVTYTAIDEFNRQVQLNRKVIVMPKAVIASGGYETVTVSGAGGGATITLYNSSGVIASGIAAASGQFEFTNINAGSDYYITQTIKEITSLPSSIVAVKAKTIPQAPSTITTPPSSKGGEITVYWETVHEENWGTGQNRNYVVELYDGSEHIVTKIIDSSISSAKIVIPTERNTRDAKLRVKSSTDHGESNYTESEKFIIDNIAPTLTISQSSTEPTNQELILTVTGADEHSGVKQVRIANGTWINGASLTHIITENGMYTFEVEDHAGNTYSQSIEITNIDKAPPTIVLTKNPSTVTNQDVTIEATITDVSSGIANKKWASGIQSIAYFATEGTSFSNATFSVSENGIYTVYVRNIAGNEAVETIEITTIDREKPIITLIGGVVIQVQLGTAFTDEGARALDNLDGDISERVVISGDVVDTNKLGEYTIYYDVTDQAGNEANQVSRVVKVIPRSVTPPNEVPPPATPPPFNDPPSTDGESRLQTEFMMTQAGGIVKAYGVTLSFPSKVIKESAVIKIERIREENIRKPAMTLLVGEIYEIGKSSKMDFDRPYTITLPLKQQPINRTGFEYELLWFNEETQIWTRLKNPRLNLNENAISGETVKVGKFAVMAVNAEMRNQYAQMNSLIKNNQILPQLQLTKLSIEMTNKIIDKLKIPS